MQTTSLPENQSDTTPEALLQEQIGAKIWDKTLANLKQGLTVVAHLTGIAILMMMLFASGAHSAILAI